MLKKKSNFVFFTCDELDWWSLVCVNVKVSHMVSLCTCDVSGFQQWNSTGCLLICFLFSRKFHLRQLTPHIFISNVLFFHLSDAWIMFSVFIFFAPMLLYTSISPCNSLLNIWHWNDSHVRHYSCVHFLPFLFNLSSFEFVCSHFLQFPFPACCPLPPLLPSSSPTRL